MDQDGQRTRSGASRAEVNRKESRMAEAVNVGLLVRIEALPGQEAEVESFLRRALPVAQDEPATVTWYAIRLGPSTFGIYDTFPDQDGRQVHLSGPVAAALMENVGKLYSQPTIEQVDVIAAKIPG
jgi:quinol monooxygenase YgiN